MHKLRKITRPFRYDVNKTPYNYTGEVTNRFKGLDLVYRMPEEPWTKVHNTVQEAVLKTVSKQKMFKKANWLTEETLQIAEKRREEKGQGERDIH